MSKAAGVVIFCLAATACGETVEFRAPLAQREFRKAVLARAKVFRTPVNADLVSREAAAEADITCRFVITEVSGTTPKFDCELPDGSRVKVKYGNNPEQAGEIAASRVLTSLGFGADRVVLVPRVRCYGCPATPFHTRVIANWIHLEGFLRQTRDYAQYRDFEWSAVERKLEGVAVEADDLEGWTFGELNEIDPSRGGATADEVDALRLMAVFLVHWDNKSSNQRLVCLPPANEDGTCQRPLVMLQDLGATFGPHKVNLANWRQIPIWTDWDQCAVSMQGLPYNGATFTDIQISDAGRRLLAQRLKSLTPERIAKIFRDARFPGSVDDWVTAFEHKVEEIADRERCSTSG